MMALILFGLLGCLVAASAEGAAVGLTYDQCKYECDATVAFTAAKGETNDVSVSVRAVGGSAGDEVLLTDIGAGVSAGRGCRAADPHTVVCGIPESVFLVGASISLGDGGDRVDASRLAVPVAASGGGGDDVIVGGLGDDYLDGGSGMNSLDGGGGSDFVSFSAAVRAPRVDLVSPLPQGAPGARNLLRSVENVDASRARDAVVLGDGGPNRLFAGADGHVGGRGGNDSLYTGFGGRIEGGAGADTIDAQLYPPRGRERPVGRARGHRPRVFDCGAGYDHLDETRLGDIVRPSCEATDPDAGSATTFTKLAAHPGASVPLATLRYGCGFGRGCPLEITARIGSAAGPVIALRRVLIPYRRGGIVDHHYALRLSPVGKARLRRRGRIRVVIFYREGPFRGDPVYTPRQGFSMIIRR